jgi:hypothetical protein
MGQGAKQDQDRSNGPLKEQCVLRGIGAPMPFPEETKGREILPQCVIGSAAREDGRIDRPQH